MADDFPYLVEYAKSSRSGCKRCSNNIGKGSVRIAHMVQSQHFDGKIPNWHHFSCFFQRFDPKDSSEMKGFSNLRWEDQEKIADKITEKINESSTKKANSKKRGRKTAERSEEPKIKKKKKDDDQEALKNQSKALWHIRDNLSDAFTINPCKALLEFNDVKPPKGEDNVLDCLSDLIAFGVLDPCPECGGQLQLSRTSNGYRCTANITGWTSCQFTTKTHSRKTFQIHPDYTDSSVWEQIEPKIGERVHPVMEEPKKEETETGENKSGSSSETNSVLGGLKVLIYGGVGVKKALVVAGVEAVGGEVLVGANDDIEAAFCISTKAVAAATRNARRDVWETEGIPVVEVGVLTALKDTADRSGLVELLRGNLVSHWSVDIEKRLDKCDLEALKPKIVLTPPKVEKKKKRASSKSTNSHLKKMTVKGGCEVDPASELEDIAHVHKTRYGDLMMAVLGMVDVSQGTNSFYKLQLAKADHSERYWVFRAWGRVGTSRIGGNKVEEFSCEDDAVNNFERLYLEKTGNQWSRRSSFEKQPKRFYPVDIDYEDDHEKERSVYRFEESGESKLHVKVQDLIKLIFNVDNMKMVMKEMEIDTRKMPLGKLSKKQIQAAYVVLNEIQMLIDNSKGTITKFLDASNRFFTLIPHDFGLQKPPLLDNLAAIKSKVDLLDNLKELEIACKLMEKEGGADNDASNLDQYYARLNTEITVLENDSEEFKMLESYANLTHASTHSNYKIQVISIYKVSRNGEASAFEHQLSNHQLLWHGSRITNFAGILSQGLRIAPPEAPSSGYMFGKGIYFADMSSKSANYCCPTPSSDALLLLNQVALGNMHEVKSSHFFTSPPGGCHSVKGVGDSYPNPRQHTTIDNGTVKVPMGTAVSTKVSCSSLLYNEYIVYKTSQVQIRYLLHVKFNFRR